MVQGRSFQVGIFCKVIPLAKANRHFTVGGFPEGGHFQFGEWSALE